MIIIYHQKYADGTPLAHGRLFCELNATLRRVDIVLNKVDSSRTKNTNIMMLVRKA